VAIRDRKVYFGVQVIELSNIKDNHRKKHMIKKKYKNLVVCAGIITKEQEQTFQEVMTFCLGNIYILGFIEIRYGILMFGFLYLTSHLALVQLNIHASSRQILQMWGRRPVCSIAYQRTRLSVHLCIIKLQIFVDYHYFLRIFLFIFS